MDDEKLGMHDEIIQKRADTLEKIKKIEQMPERARPMAYRTHAIIHMVALGYSKKEIARHLNLSEARIYHILGSASAQKEIERIQKDFFFNDPQKMFKAMVPKAARTVKKLLSEGQKGSVRLGAANTIFDRALGKPTLTIEHQGSAIKELFMAMDQGKRAAEERARAEAQGEPIEAEFREVGGDEGKDDLDNWLDANL